LTRLGDTPMKEQFPAEKHSRMINAHLESGAIEISATDWMASPALEPIQGITFAIFVIGGSYPELQTVFDKLKEGASKEWFQGLHDIDFHNPIDIELPGSECSGRATSSRTQYQQNVAS
jgi:PhnB protein